MTLNNLIDLIAEVAAKRVAQGGETKAETPDAVISLLGAIVARVRRLIVLGQKYSA